MIVGGSPLLLGDVGGYTINNSLRFRSSATAYLSRTPGVAGSRTTWTYSSWVKRGSLSGDQAILTAGLTSSATQRFLIQFIGSSGIINIGFGTTDYLNTTQTFRDVSAWYHIVFIYDTTQATASNRLKLYVNGAQVTSFTTAVYPAQNNTGAVNDAVIHSINKDAFSGVNYFDGYQAEINFIDGQALTPSSFGTADPITGVWAAKKYTGTYGTNGFYLNFSDTSALTTASNVGLGKDSSGNGNYWVTNNISITAGVTYDAMVDSPTLGAAGTRPVGNYPIAMPLVPYRTYASYSNGNLTLGNGGVNSNQVAVANMIFGADKYYWETTITAIGAGCNVGLMLVDNIAGGISTIDLGTAAGTYAYSSAGSKSLSGTSSSYGATYTTGDVIGFTYDGTTGVVTAYKNNVSQGTMTTLATTSFYVAAWGCTNTTGTHTLNINFGQRPFNYTPPSGFKALCTTNLPDSTIKAGNKYMDATLYTGTSASQSVTNAGGFKPDLVWIKSRSAATDHKLTDSVRGVTKAIISDTTGAETTDTTGVTAFGTSGFTVGSDANYNNGTGPATYVGWQWKASGSTVSNTNGTITSTVNANPTAGFSIVTYTGTGVNATVGHGLGVAPKMLIVKSRSNATSWEIYHASLGATTYVELNNTTASGGTNGNLRWNNTSPTSSVFSIGTGGDVNTNTQTYVAYCFAEIAGFSAFGSYTGNGSADGPFVYLGFRPKYVLIKCSSATTYNWNTYDSSRDLYNTTDDILQANTSSAEFTNDTTNPLDFLANGFKIRGSNAANNGSGATFIYAAFAENPFKNSLAR